MLFETLNEIADPEPHDAALNMALDEILLRSAREPLLRIYRWARPAVSFGYFVKYVEVERVWPGCEMVRRWTGGGIVPHGADLTYTLIVPREHAFARIAARESYRLIHEGLANWLRAAGAAISVAPVAQAKVSDACFENPAAFDLLSPRGKVAGAAQRRTRWGLLHQGSIQLPGLHESAADTLATSLSPRRSQRELSADELAEAAELAARKYTMQTWHQLF